MKKVVLGLIVFLGFSMQAQNILNERVTGLPVGNVGADLTGVTFGQGGWKIFATSGTPLSDMAVVNTGGTRGNAFQITGSNTATNTRFIFNNRIGTNWASRTSGNNIAQVSYDFFTGPVSTSKNTMVMALYDVTGSKILAGIRVTMDTKVVTGLANYTNPATAVTANFSFGMGASAAAPIVLAPNTWYKFGFSFNKTTGEVKWREFSGLFNKLIMGAATGTDVDELDLFGSAGTGNLASSVGVFDNIDAKATNTDDLFITRLAPTSSNVTLPLITSTIFSNSVPEATQYRFRVTNLTTNVVQTIDKPLRWFKLTELPNYDYATTYAIRVGLYIDGAFSGFLGASANVTTESAPTILTPACGGTLASINTAFYTKPLTGVTGYRFKIATPGQTDVLKDTNLHYFNLSTIPTIVYNAPYTVEVAVKTTGGYTPYGAVCNFSTPSPTMAVTTCGSVIPTIGTIYATPMLGATSYIFLVKNLNDLTTYPAIVRPNQYFPANLIPSYNTSTSYEISVAVVSTGVTSVYGLPCTINPLPSIAFGKSTSLGSENLSISTVPNPFSTSFDLKINSKNQKSVTVTVYDMIGKIIENQEIINLDSSFSFGDKYQSGVYNMVVSQGDEMKSIRVIKR